MYDVVIWGTGAEYNKHLTLIQYFESKQEISVKVIFSGNKKISEYMDGYRVCTKEEIKNFHFDYCLVAISDFKNVFREAVTIGIPVEKLIPVRVLAIPYFNFETYIRLKESRLTIISRNCWAGLCYHWLGLPFLSPTINLFFEDDDFNKFAGDLEEYLSCPLTFGSIRHGEKVGREYPVGKLKDIYVHFNHYTDFEEAKLAWERRKALVNKENILVVSSTESMRNATEFGNLPYDKKLIFIPEQLGEINSSCIPLDWDRENDKMTIGMYSNGVASGTLSFYDIFSLLEGKEGARIK